MWPPLFFIQIKLRFLTDLKRFWQYSILRLLHNSCKRSFNPSIEVTGSLASFRSTIAQAFSIGFKSGDLAGHNRGVMLFSLNQSCNNLAVRQGALSIELLLFIGRFFDLWDVTNTFQVYLIVLFNIRAKFKLSIYQ